jgi:hypothetical protein
VELNLISEIYQLGMKLKNVYLSAVFSNKVDML